MVIYRGGNIQEFQLNLIRSLPTQFWTNLLTASLKTVSLLLLVKFSIPPLHRGIDLVCNYAKRVDRIKANDESVEAFLRYSRKLLLILYGYIPLFYVLNFSICQK